MANGNDDFYDDYDFPPEEELFPMERAESAVMLAQEMKREEDQLLGLPFDEPPAPAIGLVPVDEPPAPAITFAAPQPQPGPAFAMAPQAPIVSSPLPEQTAQDRRAAYDMAIRRQDDRAALSAYQNMAAAGEGMPGVISIRSDLQPIPEPVSPAQMQYEAQRSYMDEINRGVPQQNAFAKYGPLMFPPSAKATTPANIMPTPMEWPPGSGKYILVNPKSGAVHTTTATAEEKAATTLGGAIRRHLIGAQAELDAAKSDKATPPEEINRLQAIVDSLRRQLDELKSPSVVSPPASTRQYGQSKTVGRFTLRPVK